MREGLGIGSRGAVLCAVAALVLLGALAGTARAEPPTTVAEGGEAAGRVLLPVGVAVDHSGGESAGDLYVADQNNFRVDKFDSEGAFQLAWGWGVADGKGQELQVCGPEAGHATGRCFKGLPGEGTNAARGPGAVVPEAVAVAEEGVETYVYVADRLNLRVSKFTASGEFLFMVGKEVDKSSGADICTAADIAGGDECGRGEEAASPGANEFRYPLALALDPSGNLWIGDSGWLQELEPDGTPGAGIELAGAGVTRSLAIDSAGDFYVRSRLVEGVQKLHPDGTPFGAPYPLDASGSPRSVAVDGEGNVYVGDSRTPYRLLGFDSAGALVSQFGAGQVIGVPGVPLGVGANALAVDDATKTLYVASSDTAQSESAVQAFPIPAAGPLIEAQRGEDLEPSTATLAAGLDPEGAETTYWFEYGTSAGYGEETEPQTLEESGSPYAGFDEKQVEAPLEGLVPETTYHFRLVAENEDGEAVGPDTTFTTRPAVAIEAQWASEVSARSATLHAQADPLGVAGKWWIEYGTGEALGSKTEEAALPGSFGPVKLATAFSGLAPATTYHYRFAASDERDGAQYVVHGQTRSFTTQLAGLGFSLPDGRAWEMVSPADKHGGRIAPPEPTQGGQFQAAADGGALAYLSYGSLEASPQGNRLIEQSSELARRGVGGAWGTTDLTAPHATVTGASVGKGIEYKLFAPDLGAALMEPRDTTPLSPFASERTPYLRDNAEPPTYTPLVSGAEGYADVPAGTEFGGDPTSYQGAVHVQASTPDLRHVVLRAEVPIGAAPRGSLYEWSGNLAPETRLAALSVLPGGEAVSAFAGSGEGTSVRGAISEDGSRVFWGPSGGGSGPPSALYVRDTARAQTARLDEVQGGFGTGKAEPLFWGADPAGAVAYFTDTQQLTIDASESGADLYRCEVVVREGELGCELSDLSGRGSGESARVQGLPAGMSEDGTAVYLVARGVLDTAANREGEAASAGQPNLYVWREGEGTRFIATLSEEDLHDWGLLKPEVLEPSGFNSTAAASPSGRYLAFMSNRSLTGYDNRALGGEEAVQEAFLYDASSESLTCVSCDPAGARPRALRSESFAQAIDPQGLWAEHVSIPARALAATLPEPTKISLSGNSLYTPRYLHDDGRVFFNAADSLVPADSNGQWDVYGYEPEGVGSCGPSAGGAGTSLVPGGCVSLISSGTAEGESAFIDASEGGDDAFFYSPARLSVSDEDHVLDVYDARVGGEPAVLAPASECQGEACQPPPVVPGAQTPASFAFKGPGNLPKAKPRPRRCPKGRRKVRRRGKVRCVKRRRRHVRRHRHHRRRHHRRAHRSRSSQR